MTAKTRRRTAPPMRLASFQRSLVERQLDLAAYERVLLDMERQPLPPFAGSQALVIVRTLRNIARLDCEQLNGNVTDLDRPVAP